MPDIQIPNVVILGLQVVLAFTGAFMLAIWLSLIVWTFRDVRSRSRDVFAVLLATLMVVIFGPLGLLLYFLLRPPTTLAELYERSLEEEALLQDLEERIVCPGCRRKIEVDWMVCPDCHAILKRRCVTCNRLLHLRWDICPYCVTAMLEEPAGDHRDQPLPFGAAVAPAVSGRPRNPETHSAPLPALDPAPHAVGETVGWQDNIGEPVRNKEEASA
jgi:RNA polymerase subunit RPABC4/transcription elongation factor Spt4